MKTLMIVTVALIGTFGAAAFAGGCQDGQVTAFSKSVGRRGPITEFRTCVNGRYYPYKAQPNAKGCKEGATSVFYESNDNNDRQHLVVRKCENGRYYPKTYAKITKCKEGRTQLFTEVDSLDRANSVWKVCQNGKYVNP